jgi:hypothetical protein
MHGQRTNIRIVFQLQPDLMTCAPVQFNDLTRFGERCSCMHSSMELINVAVLHTGAMWAIFTYGGGAWHRGILYGHILYRRLPRLLHER